MIFSGVWYYFWFNVLMSFFVGLLFLMFIWLVLFVFGVVVGVIFNVFLFLKMFVIVVLIFLGYLIVFVDIVVIVSSNNEIV